MKLWRVSAIYFREDDTFVVVFAFVHLRKHQGRMPRPASPEDRLRATPTAFPFRAGLTRRSPGAQGHSGPPLIYSVFKSHAAQRKLRAKRTIIEHQWGVKRTKRDLLDKRAARRQFYPDDGEHRCFRVVPRGGRLRQYLWNVGGLTMSPKWRMTPVRPVLEGEADTIASIQGRARSRATSRTC